MMTIPTGPTPIPGSRPDVSALATDDCQNPRGRSGLADLGLSLSQAPCVVDARPGALGVEAAVVLPEEISGREESAGVHADGWPHESEAVPRASTVPAESSTAPLAESHLIRGATKLPVAEEAARLRAQGLSWRQISDLTGQPVASLHRLVRRFQVEGFTGCLDMRPGRVGRRPALPPLSPEDEQRLVQLYLRTNANRQGGSMRTAAKFWALDPLTPEPWRHAVMRRIDRGQVPGAVTSILRRVTAAHVQQYRRPGMAETVSLGGTRGAFVGDKVERRRVIESDDGTLNFVACIPWPMGGDPCSDRHGVRIGRWQWLPMIEAGWSHMILGYTLVCRPRGSYRAEDIRTLIHQAALTHGLPDEFRFERGAWESDAVVELLRRLRVELTTVYQPNQKPFIEGFFSKGWTYLSVLDGQVGRFRGDMEQENRLVEACRAGRKDPTKHFPMLSDALRGIDGTVSMHNSDTITSIYGRWVPEVRHRDLAQERPWRQLPAELQYLFAPICREWTVTKGAVGGKVPLLEDWSVPYYFAHEDLWRFNGRRVRLYFDHAADPCRATIVNIGDYAGFKDGEVVLQADLIEQLPQFARAAYGWSSGESERIPQWRRAALAALRRETRMFDGRSQGAASVRSEQRDGRGAAAELSRGMQPGLSQNRTQPEPIQVPPRVKAPVSPARGGIRAGDRDVDFRELDVDPAPARRHSYAVSMDELNQL